MVASVPPAGSALPRRRLADDLRAAIGAGEIELRFQPQVAIANNRITGVEVLARWGHSRLGELGAEQLFAAAARAKLSHALSQHIQHAALLAVAAWPATLVELDIALNVTASDLAGVDFADALLDRARSLGVAATRLTLEITEHEPISDLAGAARVLTRLRQAGVAVALDDYGKGYSGEAWLHALPLDYIKLDGASSRDILGTPDRQAAVRAVIVEARHRGLGVIAEGVEAEKHLHQLAEAGATHFQGYLCAPPLDTSALAAMIEG